MADIEKIKQKELPQLFNDLRREKNPLKIQLADGDPGQLTFITDIRKRKRALHFIVKYPQDFQMLIEERKPTCLRFEFFDKENIKYVFESESWEVLREMFWIRFPEHVHRYQRRRLFRMEPPPGTRLYFKVDQIRYKLLVINVSLGGTLGVLGSFTKHVEQKLQLNESKILNNVELLFPSSNPKVAGTFVNIKRCQIKRQMKNPVTNKIEYGIEFKEISEDERNNFTRLFYKWQREFLQKRKIMQP